MGATDFAKLPHIGESVRRKEDLCFLTGAGNYTDDIVQPGQADGFKAHATDQIQMLPEFFRRHAALGAHLMVAQHRDARAKEGLRQGENRFVHEFFRNRSKFFSPARPPRSRCRC